MNAKQLQKEILKLDDFLNLLRIYIQGIFITNEVPNLFELIPFSKLNKVKEEYLKSILNKVHQFPNSRKKPKRKKKENLKEE